MILSGFFHIYNDEPSFVIPYFSTRRSNYYFVQNVSNDWKILSFSQYSVDQHETVKHSHLCDLVGRTFSVGDCAVLAATLQSGRIVAGSRTDVIGELEATDASSLPPFFRVELLQFIGRPQQEIIDAIALAAQIIPPSASWEEIETRYVQHISAARENTRPTSRKHTNIKDDVLRQDWDHLRGFLSDYKFVTSENFVFTADIDPMYKATCVSDMYSYIKFMLRRNGSSARNLLVHNIDVDSFGEVSVIYDGDGFDSAFEVETTVCKWIYDEKNISIPSGMEHLDKINAKSLYKDMIAWFLSQYIEYSDDVDTYGNWHEDDFSLEHYVFDPFDLIFAHFPDASLDDVRLATAFLRKKTEVWVLKDRSSSTDQGLGEWEGI